MVFLGDCKDREVICKYVQEHDLANVVILGSRPKEEVIAWLQVATASLLVFRDLPVLSTNSPNKLFDSLAAAVPVIQNTQGWIRSEEHTSELQSRGHLVCRLLLEKKK